MAFDIRDHIEFDPKGRAPCPACELEGKHSKNLSVSEAGAYKCFRGHSPKEIRAALGNPKPKQIPQALATATATKTTPKNVLVSPQVIRQANSRLNKQALEWLEKRGITRAMADHFQLGLVRKKVGKGMLPAISIPIPKDEAQFFQKKRVAPWLSEAEQPPGYTRWSQYGIPAMVYTTHQPQDPKQTWLCEGEWDALMLGWIVKQSDLKNDIQVSAFTCGAGNVPPESELARLQGGVIVFYDLDKAGNEGAAKVLKSIDAAKIAKVPSAEKPPKGWDVSDAINGGATLQMFQDAAANAKTKPPKGKNPLSDRLVANDDMMDNAPDFTDFLVPDLLTADELFLLAASPRAGKSLMAMSLAKAVAEGSTFMGRPCTQGPVIYIRCEDSDTKTKEREIAQGWGRGLPVYWLDKFKLDELEHLEDLIETLNVRLVVFDTLSRIRNSGINESSAEMSNELEPLQEICKRQKCTGVLVHHTGKVNLNNAGDTVTVFDTIRGSSAIRATCRGTLVLAADENKYRLCVENGWGKLDLNIVLDANTLTWRLLGNWQGPNVEVSQKEQVLNYLNKVMSANVDTISEATNLPKRNLYEILKRLQADDLVLKQGSRLSAVYVRKGIQQIQQLNSLLNSQEADAEGETGSIQQNNICTSPSEKVINLEKSDQSLSENDHFPTQTHSVELLNATPEPRQDELFENSTAIQHNSTTVNKQFNTGDEVLILAKDQPTFYGKRAKVTHANPDVDQYHVIPIEFGDDWEATLVFLGKQLQLFRGQLCQC